MRAEMPYLAAGSVAIIGGVAREGAWPVSGLNSLIGTTVLVIAASAMSESPVAPLVRAIGLLFLMASVMAAVPAFTKPKKAAKKS